MSFSLWNAKRNYLTLSNLANTASTPVSVRRSFFRTSQQEVAPASTPVSLTPVANPPVEKPKRDWPAPVRHYVQRAFAADNALSGISRQEMEIKLKQIISDSAESNTLSIIDWESLLLPQQMIFEEHEKAKAANLTWAQNLSTLNVQETNLKSPENTSKKRKSSDLIKDPNNMNNNPPWRITNSRNVLGDRISYPDKRQRNDSIGKGLSKSHNHLDNRTKRFEPEIYPPKKVFPNLEKAPGPVVGQCQDLEKRYLRLTAAPNPDTVRPLAVLEKTLDLLKKKWKKDNNYSYICDQFKSLRQDLTVQHIKTEFTVNVYEIHARIALEKGDLGEYNQCQTQLHTLYSQNLGGHPTEFKAYRILYFIHTSNRTDMNDVLAGLTQAEKNDVAVKHALDARSALALGNYHRFFLLYLETPNMGAYLMDMFVGRERLAALSNICKS